jgi:hypothetical protein
LNENSIQQWLVEDLRWDQKCTEDYFPEIILSIVTEYLRWQQEQKEDYCPGIAHNFVAEYLQKVDRMKSK